MTLRPVNEGDRSLLENLFNLYRNDINEYCGEFEYLDGDGWFDKGIADELVPFGEGVETYILCEGRHNLGLVTVTDASYALEGCAWRLQEIYLIRAARGKGIAREAIGQLFHDRPGRWCLSVYKKNHPAKRFWDGIIRDLATLICTMPGEEGMIDMVFEVPKEN